MNHYDTSKAGYYDSLTRLIEFQKKINETQIYETPKGLKYTKHDQSGYPYIRLVD